MASGAAVVHGAGQQSIATSNVNGGMRQFLKHMHQLAQKGAMTKVSKSSAEREELCENAPLAARLRS
jgi:hypothetical protein